MRRVVTVTGALLMVLMVERAPATLIDRGNGLVYDSFDNLSWTQDAAISGVNDWAGQKTFADKLISASGL